MTSNPAEYVSHGLALVDIPARRKGPTMKGWNLAGNVITTVGAAAALTGNIGLAHAYCTPCPTMALDIDDLPQARTWLAVRGINLDEFLDDDNAVQIISGKAGRAKLLYRQPAGVAPLRTAQIKAAAGGDMILEFRCASADGLTMQDVLPPSIHPDTGKPYRWGGKGDWRSLPTIPSALLAVWQDQRRPPAASPAQVASSGSVALGDTLGPLQIKHVRSALFSMRANERDHWIKMGMALKRHGDLARGIWLEWSLTSEKSQDTGDPLELSRTWDSFKPNALDYRSVLAEAQRRGWVNPAKGAGLSGSCGEPEEGWSLPEPLPKRLRAVRPLDTSCLPSTIREAVADIAERLSCPLDYVATPLLIGAGSVVGNRIGIRPKQHDDTWEVFPVFWSGIVGPPGSMKTPAQLEAMKPLRHIEEQDNIAYATTLAQYQVNKRLYEKSLTDFKNGKLAVPPVEPQAPPKPRLIVNDTTYQALGEILAGNLKGVLVHGDELSGLLQGLDTAGQEAARGFYLSGWGGSGQYTFDRIGRGSIRLNNYALSIFGGFQPDKIKQYVRGAQSGNSQNDGLLQRFQLLTWPDVDTAFVFIDRPPDRVALANMNAAVLALRSISTGVKNSNGSQMLQFDLAAQAVFNAWYVKNEELLRSSSLGAAEQSHYAKYRSLIPGLALLFHLLEGHQGAVCKGCLDMALRYAVHLKAHAKRLYGAVNGLDATPLHALAQKLVAGKLPSGFTVRSVYTKGWQDLTDREAVQQALGHLVELGWLKERVLDTGGRRSVCYDVNPDISAELM